MDFDRKKIEKSALNLIAKSEVVAQHQQAKWIHNRRNSTKKKHFEKSTTL